MIAQVQAKSHTADEYLAQELVSAERHEYRNGDIIPMTGGTPNHNDIAGNIYIWLKSTLKGKNYRTFYIDQRLWIPELSQYTYPDVMVLPKPIQLQIGRKDTVTNPCLIAEVLSKSTRNYDRGDKFVAYRTILGFEEYLLIDQYRVHVEHHVRTGVNQWLFSEYDDPEVTLRLQTLDIGLKIADIYDDINFTDE
ncbi:MAG: Uma2 family endonuclease [Merismopedia sp. SIO2A8]|nr:Uma2 family endonuclease [Merismopedia sp. SIO2A8]